MRRATQSSLFLPAVWARRARRRFLMVAGSGAAMMAAVPAYGQTVPPSAPLLPPAQTTPEQAVNLDEVVVTAQRREERLQDVPITITVVNNALLATTNARNLSELQGAVPSAYFAGNSGGGRTYVTLRGATGLALNTGDEPVAIYMDDVYLGRGVTIGMADILDVAAIEIVRGPQGTLQGRNATAGAVLIRSAEPTRTPEGRIYASVADPQEYRVQAMISGPLTDSLAGRLAVGYQDEEGWATNTVTGKPIGGAESYQGRVTLRWQPGDRFDARVVADFAHVENEPAIVRGAATTFSPLPTGPLVVTPTPQTPLSEDDRRRIFDDYEFALSPGTFTEVESAGVAARLTYSWDGVDLISVSGYRATDVFGLNDSDGLAVARQGFNTNLDESRQWSQELRLQSSGDQRLSWIVGAYYFAEDQFYDSTIFNQRFTLPFNSASQFVGDIETRSVAAFADATFALTDQLNIIGGLRYTEDEKSLDGLIIGNNLDTNVTTRTVLQPPTAKYDDTSYRIKLQWEPSDDLMLFAGYGRGFRSGGFNPFANQPPYDPEAILSLEVGLKANLFDRRLNLSLAAYDNDYEGLQLRAGVPSGGAIITNAATSKIRGAEIELTARPVDGVRISANASYTDATFESFPAARDIFDRPTDASGNRLPRTPEWQYFISAAKDFDLSNGSTLTAEANFRWRDEYFFYFTNQDLATQRDGAGQELGARLVWQAPSQDWEVAIFGTNLTNERLVNTAAVTFNYPQIGFNKPRVIGVSLERRF